MFVLVMIVLFPDGSGLKFQLREFPSHRECLEIAAAAQAGAVAGQLYACEADL